MQSILFFLTLACPVFARSSGSATGYNVVSRSAERNLYRLSDSPNIPSFDGDLQAIIDLALKKAGEDSVTYSDVPSMVPSQVPSVAPSVWGGLGGSTSSAPSDTPSLTPSAYAVNDPTAYPTVSPSSTPSDAPSLTPTSSAAPSAAPSLSAAPSVSSQPSHYPLINPHACATEASAEATLIVTYIYTLETVEQANIMTVSGEGEEILQEQIAPLVLRCLNPNVAAADIIALDFFPFDKLDIERKY